VTYPEDECPLVFSLHSTPEGTPTKEGNLWDVSAGLCWWRDDEGKGDEP
jgi:hypothetical protein